MYKTIALLLLVTFSLKIMVIDGAWLITATTGEEYVHINPFCKSKNGSGTTGKSSIKSVVDSHSISVNGICSTQVFLDHTNTGQFSLQSFPIDLQYRTLPAYKVYQDTHHPPPQV